MRIRLLAALHSDKPVSLVKDSRQGIDCLLLQWVTISSSKWDKNQLTCGSEPPTRRLGGRYNLQSFKGIS